MNRIYGTLEKRNYILRRLVCSFYTLIFMVVCIVSLVLLVFGSAIQNTFIRMFPLLKTITRHLISFRSLLAAVLFLFTFVGLYTILPKKKQNPWNQIPGAVFTAIGWLLYSYLFSLYFTNFSNFSYMYGSLTAIVHLHSFYRRRNQLLSGGTGILKSQRPGSARLALIQVNFQILSQLSEFLLMQTSWYGSSFYSLQTL